MALGVEVRARTRHKGCRGSIRVRVRWCRGSIRVSARARVRVKW